MKSDQMYAGLISPVHSPRLAAAAPIITDKLYLL